MHQQKLHGVWSSRWTFVLAATGSAVGLGNIWKFPYITGENGGGAFVLVYLVCIALVGIPIMLAEVMLGRRGRQSPINSMRYVIHESGLPRVWESLGWMGVLAGLFIMAFYSVVAAWILDYVLSTARGSFEGASSEFVGKYFGALRADKTTVLMWHTLFVGMTGVIIAAGVTKGLGMVARFLMPLLFLMLLVLLGYGIVQGDFARAWSFMFEFKFDALGWDAVLVAMGHAFFTLSLGMGAIMAYGAYMPDHSKISHTVFAVGLLDTVVALVAGLAIFPIVFASGIEAGSGPGLLFVSLPVAFGSMPMGLIFGTLFFVLVVIAAWSSSVSLIEPGVAWLSENQRFNRVGATVVLSVLAWLGGVACIYHGEVFDFLDMLTSQIMLPLGGLFIAIFVGWLMKRKHVEEEMGWEGHPLMDVWQFLLRYVSPVLVLIVFVMALVNKFA